MRRDSSRGSLFNIFPTNSNFEPYIGAGLGLSWLSANNLSCTYPGTNLGVAVDDTTLGFVYQFMAGVGYYFNPRTAVTFCYRYFDVLDRSFETPLGEINLEGIGVHNLEVGLRYFF
ncbi:outer membrane beta-barrel protein [Lusitaniella coriacea LEGE 07157]|uniref:Outer membrane beta-barrel protein n=1 Tax=Lusitaniella coriacea LEGE 07157 TaxID=945747 RepID=A0A8J7E0F9_9CYAN|nr:outer membrane beta-barrel protein [Lusitaniella coriacea LEGE 07157]